MDEREFGMMMMSDDGCSTQLDSIELYITRFSAWLIHRELEDVFVG